jgi:purine-binding chemotaxis protein CheW
MGKIANLADRPVPGAALGDEGASQFLTFAVGGEMYAIGILGIKEIIEYGGVSGVPMMPEFIRGVINVRGAVVPVVDLSARFHSHLAEVGRRSCIVIVEVHSGVGIQDVGVVVDSVSEVLEIPASEIEPAPSFGARIRTDFIRGMGKVNGRFVILLDVERVLGSEDLAVVSRAGEAAATVPEPTVH